MISQNDFRGVKKLIFSDYFSNFALVILFLIFCGGVVIGLTIYFVMFMIEMVAHKPITLVFGIIGLIIAILKVLAMQPK